jgi:hypothetical protein
MPSLHRSWSREKPMEGTLHLEEAKLAAGLTYALDLANDVIETEFPCRMRIHRLREG